MRNIQSQMSRMGKLRQSGRAIALAAIMAVGAFLGGCALTETQVDFAPSADAAAKPAITALPGASAVMLSLAVKDERAGERDVISRKINAFGSQLAAIRSQKPVASIVHDAMSDELKRRGFALGTSGKQVELGVLIFFNNYDNGFTHGTSEGEVQFTVVVRDGTRELFSGDALGRATRNVQLANGSNAEKTLRLAMDDAFAKLFAKPEFLNALLSR